MGLLSRVKFIFAMSVIAAIGLFYILGGEFMAAVWLGLGIWLMLSTFFEWSERVKLFKTGALKRILRQPRSSVGMSLGHFGMAVAVLGMAGSSFWGSEHQSVMTYGDQALIGGYEVELVSTDGITGPNYTAVRATFDISQDGNKITTLEPEARVYFTPPMPTTEAAIYSTIFGDLFVVIGEANNEAYDQWAVRIYYKPLQSWLWVGIAIMVLGGLISLSDRRFRLGTAKRGGNK